MKLGLGEFGRSLLQGQKVLPRALIERGSVPPSGTGAGPAISRMTDARFVAASTFPGTARALYDWHSRPGRWSG